MHLLQPVTKLNFTILCNRPLSSIVVVASVFKKILGYMVIFGQFRKVRNLSATCPSVVTNFIITIANKIKTNYLDHVTRVVTKTGLNGSLLHLCYILYHVVTSCNISCCTSTINYNSITYKICNNATPEIGRSARNFKN